MKSGVLIITLFLSIFRFRVWVIVVFMILVILQGVLGALDSRLLINSTIRDQILLSDVLVFDSVYVDVFFYLVCAPLLRKFCILWIYHYSFHFVHALYY